MQQWIATAPFGLEGVVADELRALSYSNVRAQPGGAWFACQASDALRANLWLRCADRVLMVCGQFEARSFEQLFEGVRALPWHEWLPRDACFPVRGKCARSTLMSVSDCQAITKKAIVEQLKSRYALSWFPENGATYPIDVSLHGDQALITLDTSGEALHRRGYRTWNGEAPLRETLAAALVALSPWRPGQPLHDPMCGTGTLMIEAALAASRRAPGLTRAFAAEAWPWMPDSRPLRQEAEALFDPSRIEGIAGSDRDPEALELARRHLRQAGLEGRIPFTRCDAAELRREDGRGVFLTNPPYGQRLSDRSGSEEACRTLRALQTRHPGWALCAISAHPGFQRVYGRRADKVRRLYNGRLECEFMTYFPTPAGRSGR